MSYSLNLAGLSTYVDQLSGKLISQAVIKGTTADKIELQTGIKGSMALNILTGTPTIQAGGTCNVFNPTNNAIALSQRNITVCPLMIEEALCPAEIEPYYRGQYMKNGKGSYQEWMDTEFMSVFVSDKVNTIAAEVEKIIWAGNTSTGTGNLARCNGLIKLFTDTAGIITPINSPSAPALLTLGNAISQVDAILTYLPTEDFNNPKVTVFMGTTNYRTLTLALRNANYFHGDFVKGVPGEFAYPGAMGVTIFHAPGLDYVNGGKNIIATPSDNLVLGVDMLDDTDKFQMLYDALYNRVIFRALWKQGVQVKFPQRVVNYVGDPL